MYMTKNIDIETAIIDFRFLMRCPEHFFKFLSVCEKNFVEALGKELMDEITRNLTLSWAVIKISADNIWCKSQSRWSFSYFFPIFL